MPARFLILGSASPDLIRASSESLAGRIETIQVNGLSLAEVGQEAQADHWLRGGFPLSFLANSEVDSLAWSKNFIQMLLERDFPQWGIRIPAATILRFWIMLNLPEPWGLVSQRFANISILLLDQLLVIYPGVQPRFS